MKGIVSRKMLYQKAATMAVVVGVLGAGLYVFNSYQTFLASFRWYYLDAYRIAMGQASEGVERSAAAAALALTQGKALHYVRDSAAPAQSISVLVYHGVMAETDGNNIALKTFTDQLLALKAAGYQTVALDAFARFMHGDQELPDRSFLLTFDDGRKDSYYPVDPLLKALDYEAVMFVITKHALGKGSGASHYYLSERELKQMLKTGRWDIQSHGKDDHDFYAIDAMGTRGHFLSNRLYLPDNQRIETVAEFSQRIVADLETSKRELEAALGRPVISFAYPFGDFDQSSVNFPGAEPIVTQAARTVYDLTFYQGWPGRGASFQYPDPNAFMVRRIEVKPSWSGDDLVNVLERGQAKELPYAEDFTEDRGWVQTWGRLSMTDIALVLSSHATTTGASVFLDGTAHWHNYRFEAVIDWQQGQSLSLLTRFQNSENFVACTFSDGGIRIEERVHGEQRIVATATLEGALEKGTFTPAMSVVGQTITCSIDDVLILSGDGLSPLLQKGGIGFATWDAVPNNSTIRIRTINVTDASSAGTVINPLEQSPTS
jgi:peptidoglycan/xylan/chitin deacetylase (PgdA/CDA1 family)